MASNNSSGPSNPFGQSDPSSKKAKGTNRPVGLSKILLRDRMPNAGFIYPSPLLVTNRHERDAKIANGLRDAATGRLERKTIEAKLIPVLDRGLFRLRHRRYSQRGLLHTIFALAAETPWADWDMKVPFVIFFRAVVDARIEFTSDRDHVDELARRRIAPSALALKIDEFLEALGGSQVWCEWMDVDSDQWERIWTKADDFAHFIDGECEVMGDATTLQQQQGPLWTWTDEEREAFREKRKAQEDGEALRRVEVDVDEEMEDAEQDADEKKQNDCAEEESLEDKMEGLEF